MALAPGKPPFLRGLPAGSRAGAVIALLVGMLDLLFIAITVIFFAAAWGYTRACERL